MRRSPPISDIEANAFTERQLPSDFLDKYNKGRGSQALKLGWMWLFFLTGGSLLSYFITGAFFEDPRRETVGMSRGN